MIAIKLQRIDNEDVSELQRQFGNAVRFAYNRFWDSQGIDTITLYPGRNPSLVVTGGHAIGEIDLISQFVVLALDTQHVKQIDIG